uniref:Adenylate kinase n=1 Tax=Peronospora matthiolae TaxID=2874970 RepID=A0AAV1UCZ2_9STRA
MPSWLYIEDFPRTIVQANKLDEMLTKENTSVDAVVIINMPDKVLVNRIAGQRVHLASGGVHFAPPCSSVKNTYTVEESKTIDN